MNQTVRCGRDRRTERTGIYHEVRMFLYDMGVAGVSFELQGTGEVLVRPGERVGAAARSVPSRAGVIITRAPKLPAAGNP